MKAAEYVCHAPDFVITPLRQRLQQEPCGSRDQSRQDSRGLAYSVSGKHHAQFPAGPAPGSILYDDLDVPPQAGQAVDELPFRDPPELSAKNSGQLWLRKAKNPGCLNLRQPHAVDDFADLVDELRLDPDVG